MRILVVEDDPRIARKVQASLEAAGYAVDPVGDGEEAWFRGDTEDYDMAVLDLGLPKLDGLAVLKKWRAAGRDLPVLVLTARGAWTERVEGPRPGPAGSTWYRPAPCSACSAPEVSHGPAAGSRRGAATPMRAPTS